MLLVDDHQSDVGELDFFFQQRVRANHQLRIALRDMPTDLPFSVVLQRASQKDNTISGVLQNPACGKIVLLRKDLRWRHQRDLAAVLNRDDSRLEAYDRFAGADVPL